MGDILADTAILSNVSKKEPLCSCYEPKSGARLQLDGIAAEKTPVISRNGFSCHGFIFLTSESMI